MVGTHPTRGRSLQHVFVRLLVASLLILVATVSLDGRWRLERRLDHRINLNVMDISGHPRVPAGAVIRSIPLPSSFARKTMCCRDLCPFVILGDYHLAVLSPRRAGRLYQKSLPALPLCRCLANRRVPIDAETLPIPSMWS